MTLLERTSSGRLRDVAAQMRTAPDAVTHLTADLLEQAATGYDDLVTATTAPSAGIDCPPAIFHGNPEAAYAHADAMFHHELALARVWTDTRTPEGDPR